MMMIQCASALQGLLQSAELPAQSFAREEFLKSGQQHQIACLIADIRMRECPASNCRRS